MKPETITRTVRLAVVKPLDGDWGELGLILRALRAPLHRVLNAVVRELELGPRDMPWWEPTPASVAKGQAACSPETASYRIAVHFWELERAAAASRVDKGKSYSGDAAIAVTSPHSSAVNGVAGAAVARWKKFTKERWKGTMSLPSFRGGGPIYIVNSGGEERKNIRMVPQDGAMILDLPLDKRRRLVVSPVDGKAWGQARELVDGSGKIGDVRLIEDDDRRAGKRKWFAMVAFTTEAPPAKSGKTMALHRGIRSFLTCATERADPKRRDAFTSILETGEDVVRHKQAYQARRRSLGKQGCPSCGHRHEKPQFGTFLCANEMCRLERNVDVIFAWNMLLRDGKTPGLEEANSANRRATGKLRGKGSKAP